MTYKNDDRQVDHDAAEELRSLLKQLVGDQETVAESARPDPEDAPLEAQIPQLVTDVEEVEHPALSGGDSPYTDLGILGFPLILTDEERKEDPAVRPAPVELPEEEPVAPAVAHRDPFSALGSAFKKRLPAKGDAPSALVRKLALLLATVVFVCTVAFLLFDMALLPFFNELGYDSLAAKWQPDNQAVVTDGKYPKGMLESFKSLYDKNEDLRGWLTYRTTTEEDFLSIDYPVMYAGDNVTYRSRDFFGRPNRNGALFFHKDNRLEPDNHSNKCLVIFGNNVVDGQMFAGLNKLVGNVNHVRAAATMTLTTLYEKQEYKVFALVITDRQAEGERYFEPLQTKFSTNGDFMNYIDQVRARSLFDFPVEVIPGDQLLMLTTPAPRSVSKLPDATITVIARKVRSGESIGMELSDIRKNGDVIMPYAWYAAQGLEPHAYYDSGDLPPLVTTTTTTMTTTTTTTTAEETTGTGEETTGTDVTGDTTDTTGLGDTTETGGTTGEETTGTDLTDTTTGDTLPTDTTTLSDATTDTTTGDGNNTVTLAF